MQRELKVLRRPVSATILDDGSVLAVLSSDHQVNIYNLANLELKHIRSVSLDNPPKCITLSPQAEVLAAAYDGGIEVYSLAASALSTDRRAVKCDPVDSLAFSSDGTMLIGTTQNAKNPNTVILSAPYYTEGNQELPITDLISHMWTSQILFPNSSRDCSHATLLPHHLEGDSSWTFTYDRVFESFRAVRTDDLRNGTTYFTGPKARSRSRGVRTKFVPCTLPTTTSRGELVGAGFSSKDIWLYGVPEGLDTSTLPHMDDTSSPNVSRPSSTVGRSPPTSFTRGESPELRRLPQWQVLVDKYRNVFAKGRKVAEVSGVSGLRWVRRNSMGPGLRSIHERLIIAAPGGVSGSLGLDQGDFATIDGGRLVILDFDRGSYDGKREETTIEVGNITPEILEEENIDMDTEVDLVRRRTVKQRGEGLRRLSIVDVLAPLPIQPTQSPSSPVDHFVDIISDSTATAISPSTDGTESLVSPEEGLSLDEVSEALDAPYSHTQPRSRTSLYRSSTAVAANRQRNPPRVPSSGHVEYRRADGRGELPHESDADNWIPPPPPYTPDAETSLPAHLRYSLLPAHIEPLQRVGSNPEQPVRASTVHESSTHSLVYSPRRVHSGASPPTTREQTLPTSLCSRQRTEGIAADVQSLSSEPISPISSLSLSSGTIDFTSANPRIPPFTPSRRVRSAFVGRTVESSSRPLVPRLRTPISPIPEPMNTSRQGQGRSVSLPSSPVNVVFPTSHLTLSGANLQQRLEYPLPPPPREADDMSNLPPHHGGSSPTSSQPTQLRELVTSCMPSAQQLANLHNRYSRPPTPQYHHTSRLDTNQSLRHVNPAPPRGALGAAGSPTSSSPSRTRAPARSITQANSQSRPTSFFASTPNLFRPSPRRLDTIQSESSFVLGHSRTRSRSQEVGTMRNLRRSDSEEVMEKGRWFGGKKKKRKSGGESSAYAEMAAAYGDVDEGRRERGGRCVVM